MQTTRIAVIGVGHLGRIHTRILAGLEIVQLIGIADQNEARCRQVAAEFNVPAFSDYRELIPRLDAAVIAVPTHLHHTVARDFLDAGVSLLIEKPLSSDLQQADDLLAAANRSGALIQVGHVEQFNPVTERALRGKGLPRLVDAHRAGPYSFRSTDIGVVLDLMIHDIELTLGLTGELPNHVEATCWSDFGGHEDVACARLHFPGGTTAHLMASRNCMTPRREMTVWWDSGYTRVDFAQKSSYDVAATDAFHRERRRFLQPRLHEIDELRSGMRGRYFAIREMQCTDAAEPLARELTDFVRCLQTRSEPLVSGLRGRDAIDVATRILHAAQAGQSQVIPLSRAA